MNWAQHLFPRGIFIAGSHASPHPLYANPRLALTRFSGGTRRVGSRISWPLSAALPRSLRGSWCLGRGPCLTALTPLTVESSTRSQRRPANVLSWRGSEKHNVYISRHILSCHKAHDTCMMHGISCSLFPVRMRPFTPVHARLLLRFINNLF